MFKQKKKYDFIFSMGNACRSTTALRRNKLQYLSLPFDWISCAGFRTRVELIINDFKGFMDKDDLCFNPKEISEHGFICYTNKKNGFLFPHDFPSHLTFEDGYKIVTKKYKRRCERFFEIIKKSDKVLFVLKQLAKDKVDEKDVIWAMNKFNDKFGNGKIELLVLEDAPEAKDDEFNYIYPCDNASILRYNAYDENNTEEYSKFGNEKILDKILKQYRLSHYGKYKLQKQYSKIIPNILEIKYKNKFICIYVFQCLSNLLRIKSSILGIKLDLSLGKVRKKI